MASLRAGLFASAEKPPPRWVRALTAHLWRRATLCASLPWLGVDTPFLPAARIAWFSRYYFSEKTPLSLLLFTLHYTHALTTATHTTSRHYLVAAHTSTVTTTLRTPRCLSPRTRSAWFGFTFLLHCRTAQRTCRAKHTVLPWRALVTTIVLAGSHCAQHTLHTLLLARATLPPLVRSYTPHHAHAPAWLRAPHACHLPCTFTCLLPPLHFATKKKGTLSRFPYRYAVLPPTFHYVRYTTHCRYLHLHHAHSFTNLPHILRLTCHHLVGSPAPRTRTHARTRTRFARTAHALPFTTPHCLPTTRMLHAYTTRRFGFWFGSRCAAPPANILRAARRRAARTSTSHALCISYTTFRICILLVAISLPRSTYAASRCLPLTCCLSCAASSHAARTLQVLVLFRLAHRSAPVHSRALRSSISPAAVAGVPAGRGLPSHSSARYAASTCALFLRAAFSYHFA